MLAFRNIRRVIRGVPCGRFRPFSSAPDTNATGTAINDKTNLILTLANVRRECGLKTGSNGTVVIGNQSSGKTSFVEALIGMDGVFEKHSGAATKRPTRVNVYNTNDDIPWVKFGTYGEKIFDMNVVRRRIFELNSGDFSHVPIEIIYGTSQVPDMLVTDFPGFISTTKAGESDDLPAIIEEMCRPAIEDDTTFKVVVMNGTVDRAGSIALREVKKAGQFHNTLGVLTRCDLVVDSNHGRHKLIEHLMDTDYLPGLGIVGVVLRSSTQLDNGVTIGQQLVNEQNFITKHRLSPEDEPSIRIGVPVIREIISRKQIHEAMEQLPLLEAEVNNQIEKKKNSRSMLQKLATGDNLTRVAAGMEELVGNLHPVAPTRLVLEKDMKDALARVIRDKVNRAFSEYFGNVSPVHDVITKRKVSHSDATLAYIRNSLIASGAKNIPTDMSFAFEQTCIFGSCATSLNESDMDNSYLAHLNRKAAMLFFRFDLTPHSNETRVQWVRNLKRCIDKILVEEDLAEICRKTAIATVVSKVDEYQPDNDDGLSRSFFEFILTKITERTNNDGLVDSINRMVNREKRPYAEPQDLAFYASMQSRLPWTDKVGFFDEEHYPKIYSVYGDEWTDAYKEVLIERMEREIYRTISVNVNDPLIREAIELAFRFFQGKNFVEEGKQIEDAIERLEGYFDVIKKVGVEARKIQLQEEKAKQAEQAKLDQMEQLQKDRQRRNKRFDFDSMN